VTKCDRCRCMCSSVCVCVCRGGVLCVHSSIPNPSRRHQSETWKPTWGPFLNKDLKHTPRRFNLPKDCRSNHIQIKCDGNPKYLYFYVMV